METHPGISLALMMLTALGLFIAAIGVVYAVRAHKQNLAITLVTGALVWMITYAVVLVGVSLTSQQQVLGLNQEKHFCGFYLDCHLGVEVSNVNKAKTVGNASNLATAQGDYYVVTLKLVNDARRATLAPYDLSIWVVDDEGRKYYRSPDAETALETTGSRALPLEQRIEPGGFYTRELAFDLPANISNPALDVTEGLWIDRAIELFLIGDEDSAFHKRVLVALTPQAGASVQSNP